MFVMLELHVATLQVMACGLNKLSSAAIDGCTTCTGGGGVK